MTNNPNELTIENSVLVLIDHQPWIALMVHSIDPGLMINNVAGLAHPHRSRSCKHDRRVSQFIVAIVEQLNFKSTG